MNFFEIDKFGEKHLTKDFFKIYYKTIISPITTQKRKIAFQKKYKKEITHLKRQCGICAKFFLEFLIKEQRKKRALPFKRKSYNQLKIAY